jgi:hypothetical protein
VLEYGHFIMLQRNELLGGGVKYIVVKSQKGLHKNSAHGMRNDVSFLAPRCIVHTLQLCFEFLHVLR